MAFRYYMTELPQSDFLFPAGGYLIGAGSLLNLGGSYFEYNISDGDPDERAIGCDWRMVGKDMMIAMSDFKKQELPDKT